MNIELTDLEKSTDLDATLLEVESFLKSNSGGVFGKLLGQVARRAIRAAIHYKSRHEELLAQQSAGNEEADKLKEQLDKVIDDLNYVKGERDKLADEIEDYSFRTATPFDHALQTIAEFHQQKLRDRCSVHRDCPVDDPFQ